ncbi:hypothetical protein AB3N62_15830 [Leptospira sp. WS4.C2]
MPNWMFFTFLYSIFLNHSILAFENKTSDYEAGYILVRSQDAYFGEFKRSTNGDIFLRNDTKGRLFAKEDIDGVVSKEYFEKIRNSSPNRSLWESVFYFHASSHFQWHTQEKDAISEDLYTRVVKISLLFFTGYSYIEAQKTNAALKDSFMGFNHGAESKFQRAYTQYQLAALSTVAFFVYSSTKAYLRFGRDENFKSLNIPMREIRNLEETNSGLQFQNRNQRIEFVAEQNF